MATASAVNDRVAAGSAGAGAPMPEMPAAIRWAAVACGVGGAIASLFWIVLTAVLSDVTLYEATAFGVVGLIASAAAIGAGFGLVRRGPGLGLLVLSGAVVGSVLFGYIAAAASLSPDQLWVAKFWAVGQGGLGAGLGVLAALTVLVRSKSSVGRLAVGAVFTAATAAVGELMYALLTGTSLVLGVVGGGFEYPYEALTGGFLFAAMLFGGLVLVVTVSGAGHWFIRAFESGADEAEAAS